MVQQSNKGDRFGLGFMFLGCVKGNQTLLDLGCLGVLTNGLELWDIVRSDLREIGDANQI